MQKAQDWGFEAIITGLSVVEVCVVSTAGLEIQEMTSMFFKEKLLKSKLLSFITIPKFFQPIRLST